eukprot:CCRYP_013065-RA/>CCRYP_013065-RA protein AED:0.02 eAED:0.02 QI:2973/1/0.66/1/1/1/3/0/836
MSIDEVYFQFKNISIVMTVKVKKQCANNSTQLHAKESVDIKNMDSNEEDPADASTSGIQVYLRIRPSRNTSAHIQKDDIDGNKILFRIPKQEDAIVNNSKCSYSFQFNGILDEKAKQKEVFRTIGLPVIKNALAGYNSTIFAYGQTGSGKTFTITGGPERYDDRGILPRTISHLFKAIKGDKADGLSYTCYVSYLEIYNQSGYDLLAENEGHSFEDIPKVTMLEDEFGHFHFKNLSVHSASSEEEALNLLFLGDTNRAIAATEMNQNSTRSHCIFTIILECRRAGADTVVRSKLNIVDLAGSERVSRTSSAGQTLREAKYINSSLFFLEIVIIALHEKKKKDNVHVPYRNSMMTSVLRDSLGGNCKTVMIATISPESQHIDESISTCSFAQRVALVKNEASINEEVEPEMIIQRLRAEVKRLRDEVAFLQGKKNDDCSDDEEENCHLPQHEINELTEAVTRYVQDFDKRSQLDFCGGITLPKIRAACAIFKSMILDTRQTNQNNSIEGGDSSGEEEADDKASVDPKANIRGRLVLQRNETAETTQRRNEHKSNNKIENVCGVPICSDEQVLDQPTHAFSWFKDRYPGLSALEKNKASLKAKYSEVRFCFDRNGVFFILSPLCSLQAKDSGKKIEEIRSRIRYHKESIEKLRRSHAITMISRSEDKVFDEEKMMAEEKFHSDAINKEKIEYNNTLEYLRKLKGNIEHSQKVVEKATTKMQSDFDVWYREMCSREQSVLSHRNDPVIDTQSRAGGREVSPAKVFISQSPDDASQATNPSIQHQQPPPSVIAETKREEHEFQLPPGIKLTGNKEADDDIIAFFKAKQVLLSRSSLLKKS